MSRTARPFTNYTSIPPFPPGQQPLTFGEGISASLLWLLLGRLSDPDYSRGLFPPPLSNQNAKLRELANYVRQAEAYWNSAQATQGSSAALLYYYAFLNLAKAELLLTHPAQVFRKTIHHGLSFNPTRARSTKGDVLVVRRGVFPLLFEKRTGVKLRIESELPVSRLLANIPEIGLELNETAIASPAAVPIYHAVASNLAAAWSMLCVTTESFLDDPRHVTAREFFRHYEEIDLESLTVEWRRLFGLSGRFFAGFVRVFESHLTFSTPTGDPDILAAASLARLRMRPVIDDAAANPADAVLSPSLYKSRTAAMPSSLARYAVMFYVSSLVRYKPSALDPYREATASWLLESFTREAALYLLANALAGIRMTSLVFEPSAYRV